MAKVLIPDRQEVKEILSKAKQYDSIFKLADDNGIRVDELEQAIRFHGLEYPVFLSTRELHIKQEFPRLHLQGLTLKQIASQLEIEPTELRYLVRKLNLPIFNAFSTVLDTSLEVKHLLETRGGTIREALVLLKEKPSHHLYQQVAKQLRSMGFQAELYRHVGKRSGNWLVLPAKPGQSRKFHRCLCLGCNTEHLVRKDNFAKGLTTQCSNCANTNRDRVKRLAVRNVGTGEIFTSIRAAHASATCPISAQVFYRKLRRDQTIALSNGTCFEFVVPPGKEDDDKRYEDYFFSDVGTAPATPEILAAPLEELEDAVEYVGGKEQ